MIFLSAPNLLLGWCFSAVAITAISVLIYAYTAFAPEQSDNLACEAPISIEKDGVVRLGCAVNIDKDGCKGVQAGDHIKWASGECDIVLGGMRAEFRLASNLPLDLNRVSREDLQFLKGVGPALAGAVIEFRETKGWFPSVDALVDVPGIGPKTLARLRRYLMVTPVEEVTVKRGMVKE